MENPMTKSIGERKRNGAKYAANGVFEVWEKRTELVKQQIRAESAANDAKTARLKALRLEKERQDAIETLRNPPPRPAKKRATAKRICAS
jgi:hypothetical protein